MLVHLVLELGIGEEVLDILAGSVSCCRRFWVAELLAPVPRHLPEGLSPRQFVTLAFGVKLSYEKIRYSLWRIKAAPCLIIQIVLRP